MGPVNLIDGRRGTAVLVASRRNHKGAVILVPRAADADPEPVPFSNAIELLSTQHIIDIVCMQERLFGDGGLKPPPELAQG